MGDLYRTPQGSPQRRTEMACASKELDPLSRFPQWESRGGDGSPHACPLDHSAPRWLSSEHARSPEKDQRMAATSALAFMIFSYNS